MGAALLGLFLTVTFARGFATILIAHVMFTSRLRRRDDPGPAGGARPPVEEAAMDLGADEWTTFRRSRCR